MHNRDFLKPWSKVGPKKYTPRANETYSPSPLLHSAPRVYFWTCYDRKTDKPTDLILYAAKNFTCVRLHRIRLILYDSSKPRSNVLKSCPCSAWESLILEMTHLSCYHIVPVARLEAFKSLKLSKSKKSRTLKFFRLESFRTLKFICLFDSLSLKKKIIVTLCPWTLKIYLYSQGSLAPSE